MPGAIRLHQRLLRRQPAVIQNLIIPYARGDGFAQWADEKARAEAARQIRRGGPVGGLQQAFGIEPQAGLTPGRTHRYQGQHRVFGAVIGCREIAGIDAVAGLSLAPSLASAMNSLIDGSDLAGAASSA